MLVSSLLALLDSGGFIPWEFQPHAALRGALHPLLFSTLYAALKLLHVDSAWMVANAPRLLQALFAGVGEYALYLLARRLSGERGARWTVSATTIAALRLHF